MHGELVRFAPSTRPVDVALVVSHSPAERPLHPSFNTDRKRHQVLVASLRRSAQPPLKIVVRGSVTARTSIFDLVAGIRPHREA